MLKLAAESIEELAKENPSSEIVEYKTKDFLKTLEGIERGVAEEIVYLTHVSTNQPHAGSVYGAEKDHELRTLETTLAKERFDHFKLLSQSPSRAHPSSSSSSPPHTSTVAPGNTAVTNGQLHSH